MLSSIPLLSFFSLVVGGSQKPNIIFMILDDMDSLLNATDVLPNYLQRLAVEGMKFENAFVASPKCCPSRTSLLSGRYTHRLNDTLQGWCGDFITEKCVHGFFLLSIKTIIVLTLNSPLPHYSH